MNPSAVCFEGSELSDDIISYIDMCRRKGTSLQQGMNFGISGNHSVILVSVRRNAPYKDRLEDGGTMLVYLWSKGGTSVTEESVQLLCARHNLQKHEWIV